MEEQKRERLRRMASGELMVAIAVWLRFPFLSPETGVRIPVAVWAQRVLMVEALGQ
jgi:hypothetical protein